jgi:hypothetical protein
MVSVIVIVIIIVIVKVDVVVFIVAEVAGAARTEGVDEVRRTHKRVCGVERKLHIDRS